MEVVEIRVTESVLETNFGNEAQINTSRTDGCAAHH